MDRNKDPRMVQLKKKKKEEEDEEAYTNRAIIDW